MSHETSSIFAVLGCPCCHSYCPVYVCLVHICLVIIFVPTGGVQCWSLHLSLWHHYTIGFLHIPRWWSFPHQRYGQDVHKNIFSIKFMGKFYFKSQCNSLFLYSCQFTLDMLYSILSWIRSWLGRSSIAARKECMVNIGLIVCLPAVGHYSYYVFTLTGSVLWNVHNSHFCFAVIECSLYVYVHYYNLCVAFWM